MLTARQRVRARKRIKAAALLSVRHRGSIHYTQGWRRWDGVRLRKPPWKFPLYADCSSHSTWLHWTAVSRPRRGGYRDYVNAAYWRAGFTGTQVNHGIRLSRPSLVGDLVFYGGSRGVPGHVATYIGGGLCVSHGSEIGPILVRWNYRPVVAVRRHLH
jgi:hypothetical protein